MEPISQILKFVAFVVVYIPLNLILMIGITFLFRLLNKYLALNFPLWVLGLAAAFLVFVILISFLGLFDSGDYDYYIYTTIVINLVTVGFMVFSNYIFKDTAPVLPFVLGKTQIITIGFFIAILIGVALIPSLNSAGDVYTDYVNEKYTNKVLKIIETNDIEGFKKELETYKFIYKFKPKGKNSDLMEYLVGQNKTDLVDIAYQKLPNLKAYPYNFDIKSPEMIAVLVKNGLTASSILLPLIRANKNDLAKEYVTKYQPVFDSNSDIIIKVLKEKNDSEMLAFLKEEGLK
jgi:hypothetical protein